MKLAVLDTNVLIFQRGESWRYPQRAWYWIGCCERNSR